MVRLIKEDSSEMNDLYKLYDLVRNKLSEMFHVIPKVELDKYGRKVTFYLGNKDSKLVNSYTLKRWVKELDFKTDVWRSIHLSSYHGPPIGYDYVIKVI